MVKMMASPDFLKSQRNLSLDATKNGPPERTLNQFFGVGPITDGAEDEVESRLMRFEFSQWLEKTYRKLDDTGRDIGPFTVAEIARSMHRGYPADKFILDMMREIHRYFEFPETNKMAIGLGGGHSGFTACALHLITTHDKSQHVFVDTPAPESEAAKASGFFRQSWGAQIVEMMRYARNGDETRIHFSDEEGAVPSAKNLVEMGTKLFVGVGHETTGATTYSRQDIANLLQWINQNPTEHHAVLDATSMLGAMPWGEDVVREVMTKCCLFMPFQKAIGGISGYYVISFTPQALDLVDRNQKQPSWAIPRQLKIAAPLDPKMPLSGARSVGVGPVYDPAQNKMLGGVINTFSTLAFAETTFGLLRAEKRIGSVSDLNKRSVANRAEVLNWTKANDLLKLVITDPDHQGAAVTLLKIVDPGITDASLQARILARSKQLLAYDGITHPNGDYEAGLDVARYVNAFPGTPGDYRAWIGGIRPHADITALLENLSYAYHRAKIVVLEEQLAKQGETFPATAEDESKQRRDDSNRAYKVLIADLVGLKFGADGKPDPSEVKSHITAKGGVFHDGPLTPAAKLAAGKIHFFYQPDLSIETEILPQTDSGQYDAVIAAATFLPKASVFKLGGVRIGAGTGNMGSLSWGGGSGEGGEAPLMNTPSFNSRATAQMVFKALLKVLPNLPVDELHARVVAGDFDTGKNLREFPTEKLEGKRIAVIGYGNIGREAAHIALAFGMQVAIHAPPRHREWIESEGFEFAATLEEAAKGADIISPHTGLGPINATTGKFANAGILNDSVFASMNDNAIVVNYDRGEVIDAAALDRALASGKIRHAAIDADLFRDSSSGKLSGPMVPYLNVEKRHRGKLELLPHAAADTDHASRVAGAKQAVDQIFECIQFKRVTNLKGDLPAGYSNAGAYTVSCVGKASKEYVARALEDSTSLSQLQRETETMAAIWGALSSMKDRRRLNVQIERHGPELVKSFNRYVTLMRKLGLEGPYE